METAPTTVIQTPLSTTCRERRSWTAKEDRLLREAVAIEDPENPTPSRWHAIAKHVPTRTNKDCRKRWFAKMASDVVKGGWAPDEDERLVKGIEKYGTRWSLVASVVQTRNSDQCAKRWTDTLNPAIDRTSWTPESDELLLRAVTEHGKVWTKIVKTYFPGRTGLAAKNRYNSITRFNKTHRVDNSAGADASPKNRRHHPYLNLDMNVERKSSSSSSSSSSNNTSSPAMSTSSDYMIEPWTPSLPTLLPPQPQQQQYYTPPLQHSPLPVRPRSFSSQPVPRSHAHSNIYSLISPEMDNHVPQQHHYHSRSHSFSHPSTSSVHFTSPSPSLSPALSNQSHGTSYHSAGATPSEWSTHTHYNEVPVNMPLNLHSRSSWSAGSGGGGYIGNVGGYKSTHMAHPHPLSVDSYAF